VIAPLRSARGPPPYPRRPRLPPPSSARWWSRCLPRSPRVPRHRVCGPLRHRGQA